LERIYPERQAQCKGVRSWASLDSSGKICLYFMKKASAAGWSAYAAT